MVGAGAMPGSLARVHLLLRREHAALERKPWMHGIRGVGGGAAIAGFAFALDSRLSPLEVGMQLAEAMTWVFIAVFWTLAFAAPIVGAVASGPAHRDEGDLLSMAGIRPPEIAIARLGAGSLSLLGVAALPLPFVGIALFVGGSGVGIVVYVLAVLSTIAWGLAIPFAASGALTRRVQILFTSVIAAVLVPMGALVLIAAYGDMSASVVGRGWLLVALSLPTAGGWLLVVVPDPEPWMLATSCASTASAAPFALLFRRAVRRRRGQAGPGRSRSSGLADRWEGVVGSRPVAWRDLRLLGFRPEGSGGRRSSAADVRRSPASISSPCGGSRAARRSTRSQASSRGSSGSASGSAGSRWSCRSRPDPFARSERRGRWSCWLPHPRRLRPSRAPSSGSSSSRAGFSLVPWIVSTSSRVLWGELEPGNLILGLAGAVGAWFSLAVVGLTASLGFRREAPAFLTPMILLALVWVISSSLGGDIEDLPGLSGIGVTLGHSVSPIGFGFQIAVLGAPALVALALLRPVFRRACETVP